jgi:hypothetical protein
MKPDKKTCEEGEIYEKTFTIRNLRPARSTRRVERITPKTCIAPTMIADEFGDIDDPAKLKIIDA